MRVVDHKTFLAMPPWTIFSKVVQSGYVSGFQVKAATMHSDFVCLEMVGCIDDGDHTGGDYFDTLEAMIRKGISVPFDDEGYGRDGSFDETALFMIYEADDLRKIAGIIQRGIEVAGGKES